jgi:hypothetical protein
LPWFCFNPKTSIFSQKKAPGFTGALINDYGNLLHFVTVAAVGATTGETDEAGVDVTVEVTPTPVDGAAKGTEAPPAASPETTGATTGVATTEPVVFTEPSSVTAGAAGAACSTLETTSSATGVTATSSLTLQAKRTTEEITLATILLNIILLFSF